MTNTHSHQQNQQQPSSGYHQQQMVHQHRPYASFVLPSPTRQATTSPQESLMPPSPSATVDELANSNSTSAQPQQLGGGFPQRHHHHHHHPAAVAANNNATPSTVVPLGDGRYGMVVVDPMTRKLTIPLDHIAETRAQQRHSIPSLCQLFLQGRCRQGQMCHQVHADPYAVHELRMQVDRLPLCCVEHGDAEFSQHVPPAVLQAALSPNSNEKPQQLLLRLPLNSAGGQLNDVIPLRNFSFTQGLRLLLHANAVAAATTTSVIDGSVMVDLTSASNNHVNLCRLHIIDRCRFAEDCKFLHVCKHVAAASAATSSAPAPSFHGEPVSAIDYYASQQQQHGGYHRNSSGATLHELPLHHSIHPPPQPLLDLVALTPCHEPKAPETPNSANSDEGFGAGSNSTPEQSLTGSFAVGVSSSTSTPMVVKKYRGSSWSYDPYSGITSPTLTSAVVPTSATLSRPPALVMVAA